MDTLATVKPTPAEGGKVLFITLPNELLSEVTQYLGPLDLLKLRLVLPQSYDRLLISWLRKWLEADTHLKSAKDIRSMCNSTYLRIHVRKVIVKILWAKRPRRLSSRAGTVFPAF